MSTVITYSKLKRNLILNAARPNDPSLLEQIDNFILFAQYTLCDFLNVIATEKTVIGQLQPENPELQKPALWNKTVSFLISNPAAGDQIITLKKRTAEFCEIYNASASYSSVPEWYSDESLNSYLISPTPMQLEGNAKFSFKLKYSILFEPLSDNIQQNVFTQRYPQILNYACSSEMFLALNSRDFKEMYAAELQKAIAGANNIDQKGQADRSENSALN